MPPTIDTVSSFVLGWLAALCRDPATAGAAAELIGPFSTSLGPGTPLGRASSLAFLDLVATRLAALVVLGRGLVAEPPVGSSLAAWRREARQVAARWEPDDGESWWPNLLDLSDLGNGLARGAIAGSLVEAIVTAGGPEPVVAASQRLRQRAEFPYRGLSVPPAPGAPWDGRAYLIPPADADLVASIARTLANGAACAAGEALHAWEEYSSAYEAGWPVPRGRVACAIRRLREAWPSDSLPEAVALDESLAAWESAPAHAAVIPPAAALGQVAALAVWLLASDSPDAQAFGRRLADADASTGTERPRCLVGCMIALEERVGGRDGRGHWVRPAQDRLRSALRALDGCEILDRHLVGQPLRQVADLVTPVGTDTRSPASERHAITRVERPGYALELPGGGRQVLARARVWVGG